MKQEYQLEPVSKKGFQNLGVPNEVVHWKNLKTPVSCFGVDRKRSFSKPMTS